MAIQNYADNGAFAPRKIVDAPAPRIVLLSRIDDSHTAFADGLQDSVAPDPAGLPG